MDKKNVTIFSSRSYFNTCIFCQAPPANPIMCFFFHFFVFSEIYQVTKCLSAVTIWDTIFSIDIFNSFLPFWCCVFFYYSCKFNIFSSKNVALKIVWCVFGLTEALPVRPLTRTKICDAFSNILFPSNSHLGTKPRIFFYDAAYIFEFCRFFDKYFAYFLGFFSPNILFYYMYMRKC